jgi:hypothetical protein
VFRLEEFLMNKLSDNWSFEVAPLQSHTCPCCDVPFQLASGVIRDDKGADLALYVGNLTPSTKPREVRLFVVFKNNKRARPTDLVVSLVLRMDQGRIVPSVVTDRANPLGQAMTREQALASPLKPLIFEMVDFIVENDPHVGLFLEAGVSTQGSGGE